MDDVGGHGFQWRAIGRLLVAVVCGMLAGGAALANPTGSTVAHGTAQFARPDANTLDITASSNAIINWQGFSVGAGETTRFIQPTASSAVLNRVTGSDASTILGRLLSNGRVFLVNPNGIVFGEDAVVDTAGLVASTLGIDDADFLAGRYEFDAGPDVGDIENLGLIESGAEGVFLLAPSVENSGVIRTDGGDLVLAAGRTITLTSFDLGGVQVEVQAPDDEVLNLGELIANRGAAGVFADSIRNTGTVEANAVTVDENGTIRLVAENDLTLEAGGRVAAEGPSGGETHIESKSGTTWVSGEVSAQGSEGTGGTIRLLGPQVGLEGAQVDASGPAGGGEVLVGGDESGEGSVPTADSTYVSADSTVSADALEDGDGGKVVVFAEGFANVLGGLSARGGPDGGDGGFVETSGLETFVIASTPDITAPNGDGGEWLIDPNDIEIIEGGGNVGINDTNPFVSEADSARLGIDLIIAALSGGATVTVRTSDTPLRTEDGDIVLNAALDVERTTGTNTLILDAHARIVIRRPITDSADGAELHLVLDAGNDTVDFFADATLYGGSLRTEADDNIARVSNGATVTLDGVEWEMNNHYLQIGGFLRTAGGTVGPGRVVLRHGAILEGGASETVPSILVGLDAGRGDLAVLSGSEVRGFGWINVAHGAGSIGTLNVESGGSVTGRRINIGFGGESGTATITGPGSSLIAVGTDNSIVVGQDGTGTLDVLDGGLVNALDFRVANSGVGQVLISGTASDGTRSRVIVSPAHGRYPGRDIDSGGYARVAHDAGSNGRLEIREGGLLRVLDGDGTFGPGFHLARNKGSTGALLIDGEGSSLEVVQNGPAGEYGPFASLGRRGGGVTTIRNGGRLLVGGEGAAVEVSRDSLSPNYPESDTGPIDERSEVSILSGGKLEVAGEQSSLVIGNGGPAADGVVTVSGPGSTLVTRGTDNRILVGDEGAGELRVLDGGLVDSLYIDVARSREGRVVIRGVAADGTRSRVIVSPAHGRNSGDIADLGGAVGVGRNSGSTGHLEITAGGLLRILDGAGTHNPLIVMARHKGSAGTVVIDGEDSRLEVIQRGPATDGNPHVAPGPRALLGWRGTGTTSIRNGGTLLVQGERTFVDVSRDSIYTRIPDPDTGAINQRSVVRIESGGRLEIDGENARMVIGDAGPAADGVVTIDGQGSVLDLSGTGNRLVVGDDGGRGTLEERNGGTVRYGELVVGAAGTTNVSASTEERPPVQDPPPETPDLIEAVTDDILAEQDSAAVIDDAFETDEDSVRREDEEDERDEDDEESEEAAVADERGGEEPEEQEELPMCPA